MTVGGPPVQPRRADTLPAVPANRLAAAPGPPMVAPREGEAGTAVMYRCGKCDTVVPYWGAATMDHRGAKWHRRLKCGMTAGCEGALTPEEARRCGKGDFRVLLRLTQDGDMGAAKRLWDQLPLVALDSLDWRSAPAGAPV